MNGVRTTVAFCVLFIAVVLAAFVYNTTRTKVLSFDELREHGSIMLPKPRALAEVNLSTDAGAPFTAASLEGKWNFLFFGFTNCPDICPTSMSIMGQSYNELSAEEQAEFRGILVTVDPERDDAESLGTYARAFSPSFTGVTGSIAELAKFGTQVNAAFQKMPGQNGEPYTMDHTGNIVIVNPYGHYHGFIKMPHTRAKLIETYRALRASF